MKPKNLEIGTLAIGTLMKEKAQWMDYLWTGTIFLNIQLEKKKLKYVYACVHL